MEKCLCALVISLVLFSIVLKWMLLHVLISWRVSWCSICCRIPKIFLSSKRHFTTRRYKVSRSPTTSPVLTRDAILMNHTVPLWEQVHLIFGPNLTQMKSLGKSYIISLLTRILCSALIGQLLMKITRALSLTPPLNISVQYLPCPLDHSTSEKALKYITIHW